MGIFDFLKKNKNIENDNGLNEIYYDKGKGPLKERFHMKNPDGEKGCIHGLYESWHRNGELMFLKEYDMGDDIKFQSWSSLNSSTDNARRKSFKSCLTKKEKANELAKKGLISHWDPIAHKTVISKIKDMHWRDKDGNWQPMTESGVAGIIAAGGVEKKEDQKRKTTEFPKKKITKKPTVVKTKNVSEASSHTYGDYIYKNNWSLAEITLLMYHLQEVMPHPHVHSKKEIDFINSKTTKEFGLTKIDQRNILSIIDGYAYSFEGNVRLFCSMSKEKQDFIINSIVEYMDLMGVEHEARFANKVEAAKNFLGVEGANNDPAI